MRHSQVALSNNYSKIAFSGHGQLVFGVVVSLILLECETVDRIKSALVYGDGGGVDGAHWVQLNPLVASRAASQATPEVVGTSSPGVLHDAPIG